MWRRRKPTTARIYYIGGASASGKSTAARALSEDIRLPVMYLDNCSDALAEIGLSESTHYQAMAEFSSFFVSRLMETNARNIVEGCWIDPDRASALMETGTFFPVYCGYPTADPEARLEIMSSVKDNFHWLTTKPRDEAIDFLEKQTIYSKWYQEECEKYGITFIDFSDFESGTARLRAHFKKVARTG
jgi:2-phosphoglycerate kinase